jgi:transmembrane sensor
LIKSVDKKAVVATMDQSKRFKNDVAPGSEKAVLTLADGSSIPIDTTKNLNIPHQGSATIKNSRGQLSYNAPVQKVGNVYYNRLTIPRGGQYQLTLPDGTMVWLNAASSIAFPTSFTGKERRVRMTGEVYFEVASAVTTDENGVKEKVPFIVNVNNEAEVKVLGTHFNINAFSEEGSIKTTLLEGSVQVSSLITNQSSLIVPGQQLSVDEKGAINVKEVNTEEVMAWKNGYFYFNNTSLKVVMQQIARWYDVEVAYEGNVPEQNFGGTVSRKSNLAQVLKILEISGVRFTIEGRKVTILQ